MAEDNGLDRAEAFLTADDRPNQNGNAETNADGANTNGGGEGASIDEAVSPERMTEVGQLGDAIVAQLSSIYDPEIPVNIYELGLIYKIDVHDNNAVTVDMTLTSPNCPVAESLPMEVQHKVEAVEGVKGCEVKIVWEPMWHPSMMTEEAQLELGLIY